MKKRFRKMVREGWTVIQLDRANLWNWSKDIDLDLAWGDSEHYRQIRTWCNSTFAKDEWEGRMLQNAWWKDTSNTVVTKEFAFKNEQDATVFVLKWK